MEEVEKVNDSVDTVALGEPKRSAVLIMLGFLLLLIAVGGSVYTGYELWNRTRITPEVVSLQKQAIDLRTENYILTKAMPDAEVYSQTIGTYTGFILEPLDVSEEFCQQTETRIDIAPNGVEYVIHQQSCEKPDESLCYDTFTRRLVRVPSERIATAYRCEE